MHSVPEAIQRSAPFVSDGAVSMSESKATYLERIMAAGDTQKWAYSFWNKISTNIIAARQSLLFAAGGGGDSEIRLSSDIALDYTHGSAISDRVVALPLHRDCAAYEHILVAYDTTQAVAADRLKFFINGRQIVEIAATPDYPVLNEAGGFINSANKHTLFSEELGSRSVYDGYISECVFIDGFALTPDAFGEWHPDSPNIWRPIDVSGLDYSGVNSFYLNFGDPTDIGKDVSGNANHFTSVNLVPADVVTDTPTNNSCTLNPVDENLRGTLSEGNLKFTHSGDVDRAACKGTMTFPENSRSYFEAVYINNIGEASIGISSVPHGTDFLIYSDTGVVEKSFANLGSNATWVNGDILGVAVDTISNVVTFYKNNAVQPITANLDVGILYTPTSGNAYTGTSSIVKFTFNEDDFTYTPPAGFNALMTKYLPAPVISDPKDYFEPVSYTGSGVARTIPTENKVDYLVIKNRDQADSWRGGDTILGIGRALQWDVPDAATAEPNGFTGYGAVTGFSIGSGVDGYNDNTERFIAYAWTKSPTSGFDIVLHNGTGVDRTVAHSLGVIPEMFWVKNITSFGTYWIVWHKNLSSYAEYMYFNRDFPETSGLPIFSAPATAIDLSVGTHSSVNELGVDHLTYLFASVEGYSKVFNYVGNGLADGPFVYCGFKPAFTMIKRTDASGEWVILDSARRSYNPTELHLYPDTPAAEASAAHEQDFLSNGFKLVNIDAQTNATGGEYIGIAFAEYPFALLNNAGV